MGSDVIMWEEKSFQPRGRRLSVAHARPQKRARRASVLRIAGPAPVGRRRRRNLRTAGYLGIELKFLDCAWNSVAIGASTDGSGGELQPSSGCTNALSVPAQGDGESQRDGRKYSIKSVYLNGTITTTVLANQADTLEGLGYYFALVLDTQANAATVVSENVYLNPATGAASMLPKPLRNLQNSKRFKILDSAYVPVGGMYVQTDGASTGSISNQDAPVLSLSWRGEVAVNCVGTTADVASASDNAIHVVAYAGATTLTPVFNGKCRTRFVG